MGQAIPSQHPPTVSRAQFNQLRALLAVALIALIGLTVAVIVVAGDEQQTAGAGSAVPTGQLRYGGMNPATGRPQTAPEPKAQAQPATSGGYTTGSTGSIVDTDGPVKDYSKNAATGD
jgi:hypothetical protein